MIKLNRFGLLTLLLTLVVPTVMAQEVNRPEPKFDRDQFERAATSVARPDFLACRNTDAKITRPSDLSIEEFSRMLHGVWVNQNRRTVHGLPVETDAAFYIDMRGGTGTAILIDRNNLGDAPLTRPFLTSTSRYKKNARPLSMTFVNCTYQFLDQYIKVSDDVPREALASSTRLTLRRARGGGSLREVWDQLVGSGYFNSFDMVTAKGVRTSRRKVSSVQGDGLRVAILPDGTTTDEKRLSSGMEPGGEYSLPMLTGALFQITLTQVKGAGQTHQGVQMRWDAEYRGLGIDIPVGKSVQGIEQGEFLKEGNAVVSAVSVSGARVWTTSECGDKNGLNLADSVSNPALSTNNLKPTLIFDRVVIGTP